MNVLPILFLDIETIPAGDCPIVHSPPKPTVSDVKVGNRKGDNATLYAEEKLPELIKKWEEECKALFAKNDEEFRKRAVNSLSCQVVCIGYSLSNEEPQVITGTELEIIQNFQALLNRFGDQKVSITLVGHNILDFDLPIIFHRAVRFGMMSLVRYLYGFKNFQGKEKLYDTMREWNLFSYKKYTKMNDIAHWLGIKGKGDIDGSKVYDLYLEGKQEEIYEYCKDDIRMLREVYYRMVPQS